MTELEQATVAFFKAVLKTGREVLGHEEFHFKIDATIATKPEEGEKAKLIGARIQSALNIARDIAKPLTIDGTTS